MNVLGEKGEDGWPTRIFGLRFGESGSGSNDIEGIRNALGIMETPLCKGEFDLGCLQPKPSLFNNRTLLVRNKYGRVGVLFNGNGVNNKEDISDLDNTRILNSDIVGGDWDSGRFWIYFPPQLLSWATAVFVPSLKSGNVAIGLDYAKDRPRLFILIIRELDDKNLELIKGYYASMLGGS